MQLRDALDDIHARGAELVIVGNGATHFARAFRKEFELEGPLLVDPELRAYRAAGLRRGRVELLSPRLPFHALRALRSGSRQTAVEGDAWQLGGVFVLSKGGDLLFEHRSREAGDHAAIEDVLAALDPAAPPLDETPASDPWSRAAGRVLSRLVDPTVVASFDRTGFRIHALDFEPGALDVSMAGRRCLVTGANAGLGYETSLALADLGADVVLLCRSAERGEAAAERIRAATGNAGVSCVEVDLSDLASVRAAAAGLSEQPVDVLVHNAGSLSDEPVYTNEGLEQTLATHVVGPHLLTRLLLPALARAPLARVIWVASGGMYTQRLCLDGPPFLEEADAEESSFDGVRAYAQAKRAQVILAERWADELRDTSVRVNAMHPGWADTAGVRESLPLFHRVTQAILRTPAEGADTIVWLAASEAAAEPTGRFFFDRRPRSTYWLPGTRETESDRATLWERCEAWADAGLAE
ncbi:MAG: SDR family NAD(P)-dependent oxidoreductase [Myxococcota bacterium]